MRLLHVRDFSFKVFQKDPEPYAILSHRWTDSETTLADVETARVSLTSTSNKITRFAQYVKSQFPGLEWIWVDTCCIDQKNLPELQEAVNSMYDWYRNAAVCIVYLSDVEHASDEVWFTRGWTLQELLASTVAVFLTTGWEVIGHKGDAAHIGRNIETLLAERTRVPLDVLQDMSRSRLLSVEERLRWMEGRDTERKEDMFYALYGIFDVAPGINYGEKQHRARQRLLRAIDEEHGKHDKGEEMDAAEMNAWLSPADPSTNHASARARHEPGTCTWLTQREQYRDWKAGKIQHLWLHGGPGCGKSVLCSTVIEDLHVYCLDHSNTGLAYFYFTFSDDHKKSYDDLVLSLVAQFARREPTRSMLRQLHEKSTRSRPGTQELEKMLISAVSSLDEAFIVVDALDESPELPGTRRNLMKQMRALLSQSLKFRLFTTSRYLPDILAFVEDVSCEHLSVRPCDVSGDIQHYVAAQLSSEPTLRDFTPAVKSMIEKNVWGNADGMFRWAFLLLDQLTKLKTSNKRAIASALKRFPRDLDAVYARILQDVEEMEDQKKAVTLLRWITYAQEPLRLDELVDALIIESKDDTVDFDDRCQPKDILRLLTSLVVIISDEDTDRYDRTRVSVDGSVKIRLAHFTVQEYLESTRIQESDAKGYHLEAKAGHHFLTQSCLTYVMHYSSSDDKKSSKHDLLTFPLLGYAAASWYCHSALHESSDVSSELKLLQGDASMRDWLSVHKPDRSWIKPFEATSDHGSDLYYASYMELKLIVQLLLEKGANVDAGGGCHGSALQAASYGQIVKVLLENGANVNAEGGYHGNALYAASVRDDLEIVKVLLENGAAVWLFSPCFNCYSTAALQMNNLPIR